MITLKAGSIIPVTEARSGEGQRGAWYKVDARAEKGYDKITVWATNPSDAKNIQGAAEIVKITSVTLTGHSYNGRWYSDYTINAELKQAGQGAINALDERQTEPRQQTFSDMGEINDDELPFN